MNEGLSDFLKTAYKYNKIKDLNEAFEEYPVEEEWHKGKIENVLNEAIKLILYQNEGNSYYGSTIPSKIVRKIIFDILIDRICFFNKKS